MGIDEQTADSGVAGPDRARHRGGRLPSGRAALGAALVVVAAAGVLAAHRSATRPPTTRYVVAARDVAAGTRLRAQDLGTLAMDLPRGVGAVPAGSARSLVGSVTARRLDALDLLRPADVAADDDADAGTVEVPVEVARSRSLGSSIHVGSRVDVLATDPDGSGTTVLAHAVRVVAVDGGDEGIGVTGGSRFRLAVPDADTATAVVDASVRSQLTLVVPDAGADRG